MVFAHVAVGQHVVAQLLGVAQAGAVAQHQPGVRAQHRDVVGDGLGVGRAHADVDHGDAGAVGAHQVVGRHLRQPRRRGAQHVVARLRGFADTARDHVAGFDEGDVVAGGIGHQLVAQLDELVDVELVVGEQHEVLEVLGRGAGVVAQPVQRIVHPRRGEQRQRLGSPRRPARVPLAMPSSMAARSGRSNRSRISSRRSALMLPSMWSCSAKLKCTGMGCVLVPTSSDTVVLQQQLELLAVVVAEQVGARQRGLVGAGAGDEAVGQARIGACHGVRCAHARRGSRRARGRPRLLRRQSGAACRAGGRCCCRRCGAPGPARPRRRRSGWVRCRAEAQSRSAFVVVVGGHGLSPLVQVSSTESGFAACCSCQRRAKSGSCSAGIGRHRW
jgi:hypothetical protein